MFTVIGCAMGPKYDVIPTPILKDRVELVVFRRSKIYGSGECNILKINGQEIGTLVNGGFLREFVTPGKQSVSIRVYGRQWYKLEVDSYDFPRVFVELTIDKSTLNTYPKGAIIKSIEVGGNYYLAQIQENHALPIVLDLNESTNPHCVTQ